MPVRCSAANCDETNHLFKWPKGQHLSSKWTAFVSQKVCYVAFYAFMRTNVHDIIIGSSGQELQAEHSVSDMLSPLRAELFRKLGHVRAGSC